MTKRFLTVIALLFAAGVSGWAQDIAPSQNSKGKWGYVDDNGAEVIGFKYDEASPFVNGYAKVKKKDLWGFIDAQGKEVVPIKYNIIEPFGNNVFKVAEGGKEKDGQLSGEKYGFIDITGRYLVKDLFNEVGAFVNGVARVMKNDKYGFIDENINLIVPCQFKAVGDFNEDGFVWVNDGCSIDKDGTTIKGGKYGIYNNKGKMIVAPKYKTAGRFTLYETTLSDADKANMSFIERTVRTESGTHRFLRKTKCPDKLFAKFDGKCYGFYGSGDDNGKKNSVVDLDGNVLIPENTYQGAFFPDEGFAPVVDKNGKWNFVNVSTGALLLSQNVSDCNSFENGVAVVQTNDSKWRLVNHSGSFMGDAYDYIYPRREDAYVVRQGEKYGALNSAGEVIKAPVCHYVFPMSNGLMAVLETLESTVGYIDISGKYKIQPKYYAGFSFKNGIAAVKGPKGFGYIDTDNNVVVECKWNNIYFITSKDQKITWVKEREDSKWKALDIKSGQFAFDGEYDSVELFGDTYKDVAIVSTDEEHFGCIDANGKTVIRFDFNSRELAVEAYQVMLDRNIKEWRAVDSFRLKLWHNPGRNKKSLYDKIEDFWWDY